MLQRGGDPQMMGMFSRPGQNGVPNEMVKQAMMNRGQMYV
jgi:hypothetical protein